MGLVVVVGGAYLFVNMNAPKLAFFDASQQTTTDKLTVDQPKAGFNKLYIPEVNVDLAIVSRTNDSTDALIQTTGTKSSPDSGGNFVLSAQRFNLRLSPQQTRAASPFYGIDNLHVGAQVFVDWSGTRYAYQIDKKFEAPSADEAKRQSSDSRLTLFASDSAGELSGRTIIEAKPIGTVAFAHGQKPFIDRSQ